MMVREAFIGYDKKNHHIDGMKRIFFDPGDKRRFWTIYYEVPEGIALNDVYVMQQAMIFAGFVITFLAIVIFL